jgi:hypothetical protein
MCVDARGTQEEGLIFLMKRNWVSVLSKDKIFLFSAVSRLAVGPSQLSEFFLGCRLVEM